MLTVKYSHAQYQNFVHSLLSKFYIDTCQQVTLFTNFSYLSKLWNADLSGIVTLIRAYYSSSIQGAPPKDAVALLRSLILMAFKGVTSIPAWVETLLSDPFFAILSDFIPACLGSSRIESLDADPIPGVGTFYDFMDRLIRKDRVLHRSNLRHFRRMPKSTQKKNQKMDTTLTERLVKRVIKYSNAKLPNSIETSLNLILKELLVLPSLKSGLLGDPQKFNTAGDGTCMPTHASHYGKKVCDCDLKPGESCKCKRKFTDPSATWGWDSYNEQYFYVHSFHVFTAADSFYSLPIHIKCVIGERHDSVTGIFALKETVDLYPEINFYSAAFDSGYDNTYFYLLNQFYNICPVIALNGRNSKPVSSDALIKFDVGYQSLISIVPSTVNKILNDVDIKPHKIRYYLEKRDPEFDKKMDYVLIVYKQIKMQFESDEKTGTITISYDEKPGIQAIGNVADDLQPTMKHGFVGRDSEYKRFVTISLLAGMDLMTGEIIPLVRETHRSADFVDFLKLLDEKYDKDKKIKIVLDNHSAHTSKETRKYLEQHPGRFEFIFTPKHGSWLNMIESFFGKFARVCLKGIRVKSKDELVQRIYQYMDEVNAQPVIYRWKYKMDDIVI